MVRLPPEVVDFIAKATKDEIEAMGEMSRRRWSAIKTEAAREFAVGDRVAFKERHDGEVSGFVEKVNYTTLVVKADSGMRWNVSTTLVKKVV